MKTRMIILFLCTIIFNGHNLFSQSMPTIDYLKCMQNKYLPFYETKVRSKTTGPYCNRGFNYDIDTLKIPFKTYDNLNLLNSTKESVVTLIRRFNNIDSGFYTVTLEAGESDWRTNYIATLDANGYIIDYIESGALFYTSGTIAIKQYSVSTDLKVTVYTLNVTSPLNVDPFNFTTVTAQRIDKVYQIDSSGHFTLIQQKNYIPKSYLKSYLEDTTKDIWLGGETLL